MKRFVRAICIVALTFSTVMGVGSSSNASDRGRDGYYYDNRDYRENRVYNQREKRVYEQRYRRAYHNCADRYRIGGHRFQRCMNNYLGDYHRW
jgi:hypothetical protein